MANPVLVPVVAHRVFGRSFRAVPVRRPGLSTPGSPFGPGVPLGPTFEVTQVVDESHGTRRSVEEIRRLFHEGDSPSWTHGWSVNRLWSQARVQFVLTGIVDQAIDSHLADFIPADVRFHPDLSGFRYENALNIFFSRVLQGARGWVSRGDIVMADRWDPAFPMVSREDAWRGDVITVGHEIGHVFDLSHRGARNNVMYGQSTSPTSTELTPAQAVFCLQRARAYRRPWYRAIPDNDDVQAADLHVPHVAGHASVRLPTFE